MFEAVYVQNKHNKSSLLKYRHEINTRNLGTKAQPSWHPTTAAVKI